jgi:hypothetical protein
MKAMLLPWMMLMFLACYDGKTIFDNIPSEKLLTMLAIDADTLRLPIEIPEPAWLQTRFSMSAWLEGLLTDTHSSRLVTYHDERPELLV